MLAGHRQLLAAMGTAGGQHATTILCCHSLTETVLVYTATVVWLKCSFHLVILFNNMHIYLGNGSTAIPIRTAKLLFFF